MKTKPALQLAFEWAQHVEARKPGIAEASRVSRVSLPGEPDETRCGQHPNAHDRGCGVRERVSGAGRSASSTTARKPVQPLRVDSLPVVHVACVRSESNVANSTHAEDSESGALAAGAPRCRRQAQLDGVAFDRALRFAHLTTGQLEWLVRRQPAAFVAWFWWSVGAYPATRYVDLSSGLLGASIGGCS